ncbi:MAG: SDR family oxidoreductase [Caldilineaceae bacterium]|nr:SDR family oxidoreductase [Caldilineaceae bacterium]
MELLCQGQRAVVTAAATGIGRVITETLVANGAQVYICDVNEAALAACQAALPTIGACKANVANEAEVDAFFEQAVQQLGGIDLLVNNAGIAGPTAPVEAITLAQWEETLAVNMTGQFLCTRRAVPHLKAAKGGLIVNLSSAAGLFGFPNRTPYAAAKWAVIGFTKSLAMELGGDHIRVNAICPGIVEGERQDRVIAAKAQAEGRTIAEVRTQITRQNSMRTFVQAQDIANMILFLASPAGNKISGQALSIDGHTESLRT